jgi:cytochrome c oxidase subunit 2
MKKNVYGLFFGAIVGIAVSVWLVEKAKDPKGNFTKFDNQVLTTMHDWFLSPEAVTDHGQNVDRMIWMLHVLMGILFVGWGAYYIICLMKFRQSVHPKADYAGVTDKTWSTLAEYGVIVIEVILLVSFSIPLWVSWQDGMKVAKIKEDGIEIHVLAKQFDWNARYAGSDREFAPQFIEKANKATNPFGLDPEDSTIDDVIVLGANSKEKAIVVPWGESVVIKVTSMDVIHSFKVLPLRALTDAIPGLQLPVYFRINEDLLPKDEKGNPKEAVYLITCAQLCGEGHGYMSGYLKVVSPEKYKDWIAEQSASALAKRSKARLAAK